MKAFMDIRTTAVCEYRNQNSWPFKGMAGEVGHLRYHSIPASVRSLPESHRLRRSTESMEVFMIGLDAKSDFLGRSSSSS
ncbi:hypothetical protein CDAR_427441 [Caerostris darwini]|uniref:Uncharacterized protein n=1 Tax=Caerostris darwini TaxID=1538125 RepID=A0AAV4PNI6_9ARAC|nr:hypothetical protein CDAR_427441 [Caerostris darwini]